MLLLARRLDTMLQSSPPPPTADENPALAWRNRTTAALNAYYGGRTNQFPSLDPTPGDIPNQFDRRHARTHLISEYFTYGMPWPGPWAFDAAQTLKFGTPEVAELKFRTDGFGADRCWLSKDYREYLPLVSQALFDMQDYIAQGQSAVMETHAIDFFLNKSMDPTHYILSYVKVRPCIQKQGLFTLFLYVAIDALFERPDISKFTVEKALPLTTRILEKYGFRASGKQDSDEPSLQTMELPDRRSIESAKQTLAQTTAVTQKLGTLEQLTNRMHELTPQTTYFTLNDCPSEYHELERIERHVFRHTNPDQPHRRFYLKPDQFPTEDQLADPEYIAALFPPP